MNQPQQIKFIYQWCSARANLSRRAIEIEAEATAHRAAYVSRHSKDGDVSPSVSLGVIAKVARRIEDMTRRRLSERRPRFPEQGELA